jgi:lipoate-protein ligase A
VAQPATDCGQGRFEVLLTRDTDPAANLALEQQLLREVNAGTRPETARLWVNDECLVRGPHRSRTSGWYHEERARALGLRVYTRSTGGGCVYHDRGNLNWSFYLRRAEGFVGYRRLFEECSALVISALQSLGIAASFGAPNRIDIAGRKISGLAARAASQATLVHGTLLVSTDLERIEALCIPPPGCPRVARICDFESRLSVAGVMDHIAGALMGLERA